MKNFRLLAFKMVKAKGVGKAGTNRWLNYLKSYREKNAAKPDKKQQSEILKEAGRLWKEMSDTEKDKYGTVVIPKFKK